MISSVGDNGSARYIKLYKLHLEPDHKENEKRLTFFFATQFMMYKRFRTNVTFFFRLIHLSLLKKLVNTIFYENIYQNIQWSIDNGV